MNKIKWIWRSVSVGHSHRCIFGVISVEITLEEFVVEHKLFIIVHI